MDFYFQSILNPLKVFVSICKENGKKYYFILAWEPALHRVLIVTPDVTCT